MSGTAGAPHVTDLHLEHCRHLFLSERSRRETIRGSISTPVAAISFAVFALSNLAVELDVERWRDAPMPAIMALGIAAVAALFASAWHVVLSEWLFVYHEPPRLDGLLGDPAANGNPEQAQAGLRTVLTASYAIAYEQYLRGNAVSSRHRTWALRLILLSLLLQGIAFTLLPFHLAGA
jgi:hypothetical protein